MFSTKTGRGSSLDRWKQGTGWTDADAAGAGQAILVCSSLRKEFPGNLRAEFRQLF